MTVKVKVAPSDSLEVDLQENRLGLALMEGMPQLPALCSQAYQEDLLVVIAPPAASLPSTLSREEFCRQSFLLRDRGIREEFERVMAAAGLSVTPLWEASSTTALVNAVIAGLALQFCPAAW